MKTRLALIMSTQRWQLAFLFFILKNLLTFMTAEKAHFSCIGNDSYSNNSAYRQNLNTLFSFLPSNVNINGFYNASAGENPDRVNAVFLCRGDVDVHRCRRCVQNATLEILRLCPSQKQAILWYDFCMLRYSNESIFGTMSRTPTTWFRSPDNAMTRDWFMAHLRMLLDDLRRKAVAGGSLRKVAAGNTAAPDFQTIYALVQCTPDLSSEDCETCLTTSSLDIPRYCNGSIGGGINRPSCTLRYEVWPFYNETMLQEQSIAPMPSSAPGRKDDDATSKIIIAVVSIAVSLLLAACGIVFLRTKIKQKHKKKFETDLSTVESLQYDFDTIRAATNEFSEANKLGQGGFGAVYWGKLLNDQEIAAKRLSVNSEQGDAEFRNEVLLVAKLQHRNLARLLGFSMQESERLLVYEFVQNGSLDHFIFDSTRRLHLKWDRRFKIIGGIAKGLLYLHEDSLLRIIHRDLKSDNILLDGEMTPKIADFGTATFFVQDETQGTTSRIVGTYGYMPPEYATQGHFSVKSDVFSFGVLVLEIISGQRNNNFRHEENVEHLPSFAWRNWRDGTTSNIIDPMLRGSVRSSNEILKCIHIGLLCVQQNAEDRPTMNSIVLMLNSLSITLPIPSQPGFFMPSRLDGDVSLEQRISQELGITIGSSQSVSISSNEVSLNEFYPR